MKFSLERLIALSAIVALIILNVNTCNSKRNASAVSVVTSDACDTVYLEGEKQILYVDTPIPSNPDTVIVIEKEIVEVPRVDSVFIDRLVPKLTYIYKELPVLVYDSIYLHDDYTFKWRIESYGQLKSFQHQFTPHFEVKSSTTNIINPSPIDRTLSTELYGGLGFDLKDLEISYYAGLGLTKNNKRFLYGGAALLDVKNKDDFLLLGKVGIRF